MENEEEWVAETLSATLGLSQIDHQEGSAINVSTAVAYLMSSRQMSEEAALFVIKKAKCSTCKCEIGEPHDSDKCDECPCHCDCCCPPPLSSCLQDCECVCPCHETVDSEEEQESESGSGEQTEEATSATSKKEDPENEKMSGDEADNVTTDSGDDDMNSAPIKGELSNFTVPELTEMLAVQLRNLDDQGKRNARQIMQHQFAAFYTAAAKNGKKPAKVNEALPTLNDDQLRLLYELLSTLQNSLKYVAARLQGALKDIAIAAAKSSWSVDKILDDRLTAAKTPRAPAVNVWTQSSQPTDGSTKQVSAPYEFDPTVFTPEEQDHLTAVCLQKHVFAAETRDPSEVEWEIMMGLIQGTIIAKALPQFLKRCCALPQLLWLHDQIIQRAEGELWTTLPPLTKIYNYNQSSRRLTAEIRQSAKHQKWEDARLESMLNDVKVVSYNAEMHSLHFFFFTKAKARTWEGMPIPFRATKLVLGNPDSKIRRSENHHGLPTDDEDGLTNDRYQAHYKMRLMNIPRTMDISAIAQHLQLLTANNIKIGIPLDSYGQHSEGSLSWDFLSTTPTCPPALMGMNRLVWGTHVIMIHHRPGVTPPPCLTCAQVGHQAAACKTAEGDLNASTIIVGAPEIAKATTKPEPWKTPADALALFRSLKPKPAPTPEPTKGTESATNPEVRDPNKTTDDNATNSGQDASKMENDGSTTAQETNTTPTNQDSKAQAKAANNQTTGTTWQSASKKKKGKKKNNPDQPPAPVQTKPTADKTKGTATAQTPPAKTSFIVLSESDDEEEPESENEDDSTNEDDDNESSDDEDNRSGGPADRKGGHRAPPGSQGNAKEKPNQRRKPQAPANHHDEAATLRRGIQEAKMETLRRDLNDKLTSIGSPFELKRLTEAIHQALPNCEDTSSLAWILESVNGRLSSTPMNGNCQPASVGQALHQQDLALVEDPEAIVETTMLLKYGAYLSHLASSPADLNNNNIAAILDSQEGTPTDTTPEAQRQAVTRFYQDFATSDSTIASSLPKRLWGRWDTLRMFARFLGRPIFLITEHAEPTNVFLSVIRLQRAPDGSVMAGLHQPGPSLWLKEVEKEALTTKKAPIILSFSKQHYNCVIFDRHQPATKQPPTKKLKPARKLYEHWAPKSTTNPDATPKTPAAPKNPAMTRRAILASGDPLTDDDFVSFLTAPEWETEAKLEIIKVLVAGTGNFKEVLTFSTSTPGSDHSQGLLYSQTISGEGTDSDFDPEPTASSTLPNLAQATQLSAMSMDDVVTGIELTPLGKESYRQDADRMWQSVQEEWRT